MKTKQVMHGRMITPEEVEDIRRLLREHPDWSRRRLSQEVCSAWGWCNAKGEQRDIACRTVLLRLHRLGEITLPVPRHDGNNNRRGMIPEALCDVTPIHCSLRALKPLTVTIPRACSEEANLFKFLIQRHHYLGLKHIPGENMAYLVRESCGQVVACLLFTAAAWRVTDRDLFIGWSPEKRTMNLSFITNNARFLVPPWVEVKCLASHVLSLVCRRIRADWIEKYGHPVHLLETFVDKSRFRGVCYQAANWRLVGRTVGRTRNDRFKNILVPIKDIRVYPLTRHFRQELCQ